MNVPSVLTVSRASAGGDLARARSSLCTRSVTGAVGRAVSPHFLTEKTIPCYVPRLPELPGLSGLYLTQEGGEGEGEIRLKWGGLA